MNRDYKRQNERGTILIPTTILNGDLKGIVKLIMKVEEIVYRIQELRLKKGITAREMSIQLGQSPAYINRIETNRMTPSLASFLEICDLLEVSPASFFSVFDKGNEHYLLYLIGCLNEQQRQHVICLLEDLNRALKRMEESDLTL